MNSTTLSPRDLHAPMARMTRLDLLLAHIMGAEDTFWLYLLTRTGSADAVRELDRDELRQLQSDYLAGQP